MAQKHLKELLKEDQEPFYLKDYIADKQKQCFLKKQAPRTQIQLKKQPKPTSIFSKNVCFFSLQDSPDHLRRSPLLDIKAVSSPVSKKSPHHRNNSFINVPAKTASLLLEAALRIQKQSKPNNKVKNLSSFGLFGSMLKRLSLRNRTHNKLKTNEEEDVVKNILVVGIEEEEENVATISCSSCSSVSCSSTHGGSSSLDFESSVSGRSFEEDDYEDEFEFANVLRENQSNNNGDYASFCLSPFRFALHTSPSPSPKSPARRKFEDIIEYEQGSPVKCQLQEDEEDKEQNSPVSVLDTPFEDDYDGHEEDYYDRDCSYAFVQRAKQQLLHKLHRFEKLAALDPTELEKRMIEEEDEIDEFVLKQGDDIDEHGYQSLTFSKQRQVYEKLEEVIAKTGNQDIKKPGIKRLISDIIMEEQRVENEIDEELLIKRVCKRLESCKEVKCNTIDMMVEMDLRREIFDWKKPQKTEISETETEVEVAIFAVLVDELVQDLAFSC